MIKYVLATVFAVMAADVASAGLLGFRQIMGGSPDGVAGQFSVDVRSVSPTTVEFKFFNNGDIDATVSKIAFLGTDFFNDFRVADVSDGVAFRADYWMPNLQQFREPQARGFGNLGAYSAVADWPSRVNGINNSAAAGVESLALHLDLQDDTSYSDVLAALTDGSLRVYLRGRDIGTDSVSGTFVNTGLVPVPAPAAVVLGVIGIALVGGIRRWLA
jgi:hypothetical protein